VKNRDYDTCNEPGERLLVCCRNRRATVCPACSRLHAGDTYHLVRAGLLGGKNVPPAVRHRPRLFITLTAPSFGPVHRAGEACRPPPGGRHLRTRPSPWLRCRPRPERLARRPTSLPRLLRLHRPRAVARARLQAMGPVRHRRTAEPRLLRRPRTVALRPARSAVLRPRCRVSTAGGRPRTRCRPPLRTSRTGRRTPALGHSGTARQRGARLRRAGPGRRSLQPCRR